MEIPVVQIIADAPLFNYFFSLVMIFAGFGWFLGLLAGMIKKS